MSQHDPHDEHSSFIKTPKQLIVVVVLAFVVPVLGIALIASIAFKSLDPHGVAASDETVAKRLKPVGEVAMGEGQIPPEADAAKAGAAAPAAPAVVPAAGAVPAGAAGAGAAPGPAAAAAPAGGAGKGKATYDQVCAVCHAAGVAGAPKMGDKAAWAARLKQGMDTLHASALKGKGAMPPKGGNTALSDADVMAAVDYMAGASK